MGELARRTLVGMALVTLALATLVAGGIAFWILVSLAGVLMMGEWCDLHHLAVPQRRLAQFAISVPLAIMSPLAAGPDPFALGLLVGAAAFVTIATKRTAIGWGALYVGLPVLALLLIRERADGLVMAIWTMALVWATDIGAYFAGRAIGGPRLAPRVSPNKTWAGLGGGIAGATVFAALLGWRWGLPPLLILVTPLLAIAAQVGDLYESWLKRRAGVKDSGAILPGHGGALDRLDGLVPVAPLAALLIDLATRAR